MPEEEYHQTRKIPCHSPLQLAGLNLKDPSCLSAQISLSAQHHDQKIQLVRQLSLFFQLQDYLPEEEV
uniref:Uncharacterized protein n=1 Tax=Arundo donax TaxID=35708 RepID=A0A0A9DN98_ARUDO